MKELIKNENGFTAIEVMCLVISLAGMAGIAGAIYMICHFIAKFW